jgi:hypothetical protein
MQKENKSNVTGLFAKTNAKGRMCVAGLQQRCSTFGNFDGSEDATLWRAGLAFQSSGLERPFPRYPKSTQSGEILLVSLPIAGGAPSVTSVPFFHMSSNFGFRPHGIHLDNLTQRMYAVSHSTLQHEESIAVFAINDTVPSLPTLNFLYALTSPHFIYHGVNVTYFLNDVAVVDGKTELYTTQFGPQLKEQAENKPLWRCTWNEADKHSNGRLPAICEHAHPDLSLGLNGIAIHPDSSRLWVNDLYKDQLWVFDRRLEDGKLVKVGTIPLPGMVDNCERDWSSGELTMGMMFASANYSGPGGAIVAVADDSSHKTPCNATIMLQQDTGRTYQVSTSLVFGQWTILGSPWDTGLIICDSSTETEADLSSLSSSI